MDRKTRKALEKLRDELRDDAKSAGMDAFYDYYAGERMVGQAEGYERAAERIEDLLSR